MTTFRRWPSSTPTICAASASTTRSSPRGGDEALDLLGREPIDCVVLDLEMPGTDGFEVLRRLRQRGIDVPVIVYTGTGSYDRCVQAVRLGAYGFIDKTEPSSGWCRRSRTPSRAAGWSPSCARCGHGSTATRRSIGDSAPMRALRDAIARVAPIPSSVLIIGESGTGKELVARELHRLGPGEKNPLVAVNSAALPEQLVESELFGHERGAFTGADRLRRGAFENAGTGTLFLDEVGELPLPSQAKLLRVLEDRKVMRVGGDRAIPIAARVIAATNRELEREVEAGRFRQDLSLSPERPHASRAAASRSAVRHSRDRRAPAAGHRVASPHAAENDRAGCGGAARRRTTGGRTTCASCETCSSA